MRRTSQLGLVFLTVLLVTKAPTLAGEEPLDRLLARADSEQDAKLFAQVSLRLADQGRTQYNEGDGDKSKASVQQCSEYADKSFAASRRGSYRIKDAEITLRKAQRVLEDLAHAADIQDRQPIADAAAHLAKVREDMLHLMFDKGHS
jgi:hypothetical protein